MLLLKNMLKIQKVPIVRGGNTPSHTLPPLGRFAPLYFWFLWKYLYFGQNTDFLMQEYWNWKIKLGSSAYEGFKMYIAGEMWQNLKQFFENNAW